MRKHILLIAISSLIYISCTKEQMNKSIQQSEIESSEVRKRGGGPECPASYITVTPCFDKFNFQLHYGPNGTGGVSPWCFSYVLKNSSGTTIQSGSNIFHGGATIPSSLVTQCQTYTLEFTGCCGSIYTDATFSNTLTLQSDGCGGIWNC